MSHDLLFLRYCQESLAAIEQRERDYPMFETSEINNARRENFKRWIKQMEEMQSEN